MVAQIKISWYSKHKNIAGHEHNIIQLYQQEHSVTEIAKQFSVNVYAIKSVITKNGLQLRNPKESRNLSRYNKTRNTTVHYKFTSDQLIDIKNIYNYGYGVNYIAKKYKVDNGVIIRILNESGITVRDKKEQLQFKHITTELFKQTIINKFGGWSVLQQKHQDSVYKKYGVSNVMQIPSVYYKQQLSGKKYKQITINGKEFVYQGYEDKGIMFLLQLGYGVDDIISGKGNVPIIPYTFNGKNKIYYPDLYIPKDNLIVEVKSIYTMEKFYEQNIAKKEGTEKAGFNLDFLIF